MVVLLFNRCRDFPCPESVRSKMGSSYAWPGGDTLALLSAIQKYVVLSFCRFGLFVVSSTLRGVPGVLGVLECDVVAPNG